MYIRRIEGVIFECCRGDIANQPDMDAVVNAANAQLKSGGGVAGAIHRAAGAGLEEECRAYAPIEPGEAVISGAHGLPNRHVVHCLGPIYGRDDPADELLASCYRSALRLADANRIRSIAFPAISTGAFGYPMDLATEVAFSTLRDMAAQLSVTKHIRFVLHSEQDLQVYKHVIMRCAD